MGKGIVKLGEGQWATKDGKLLAAKETNGRFKNAEFTVTRGSDATYTDKDGLIKRISAPRNRTTTSSNTLDLFVLAGQSNAMGWLGNASGYPPQEPNLLDSSIKLNYEQIGTTSKSDGWQTLGPQQRQNYGEIFGPEVTFSRLLKKGGYNPAIFKYTQGSTSLERDWKAPGQSGHYDTMVTKFNSAVLDLQNQGYVVNIAGFIWVQGEQDATSSSDASNYQSNLNAIISDFRTNVASNSTLQFVLGVDEGNPASNIGTIVAAQNNIANGDVNIVRSSMVGLEKADSTHLTPAGIIDHGKRIYDSMFDLASAEPRIDFTDNTDGHLLLEPESTNLITYSEDFSQWSKEATVTLTPNYGISPDGTQNSTRMQMNEDDSVYVSASSGLTASFYVKGTLGETIRLSNGSATTHTLTGNWDRIETYDSSSTSSLISINTYSGATARDIEIWGAQLENLPYATSYIPTNGGQVTRDAETCTGAGEAIDFNSEEGVLYAEIAALADSQTYRTISLNDGTNNECVRLRFNTSSNTINGLVRDGATARGQISYQVSDIKQFHKAAFKYKSGDCQLWIDGVQRATSTDTFTLSTQTQLNFNQGTSSDIFYGKCKAIRVYKDASIDLATLTS